MDINEQALVLLQSRPITTLSTDKTEDKRGWYLSLHRSFENLKELRRKIEEELIPGMIAAAERLGLKNLRKMSDQALADEIRERLEINQQVGQHILGGFYPLCPRRAAVRAGIQ